MPRQPKKSSAARKTTKHTALVAPRVTQPKSHWKQLHLALFITLVIGASTALALNRYHAHQTHQAQQAQLTRLNAASTDLKKVYDQLLTTLPNIREHSFEKSCGQSSDVLNNGTITCGTYVSVTADGYNDSNVNEYRGVIIDSIPKTARFAATSIKKVDPTYRYGYSLTDFKLIPGTKCSIYDSIYSDLLQYNKANASRERSEYTGSIYKVHISCSEIVDDFLPGYTVEK